ncbi:AAA domain-containing protein [Flavobacterium soyangense]|uniref:AAA family ATPase n=1 Tax=Flavobacterium soyangense TaxID=2023265 RepID=A0A930XUZ1_9FLAO|nr:AAA domain-containing protein [Flavobacterium soyangense]MBF2707746.1 AAA family ATPase [Flavobacterium soyangense]
MKKEKYLQIFNYLKEFSNLRSNPVRDINVQETQYPEKFWLNDIPVDDIFENIIRPDFNTENDYWIRIKKPKEPSNPEFAKLSEILEKWVDKLSLINDDNEPILKESIEIEGEILVVEDYPEVSKEFQNYINQKWIDDLIDYSEKVETYDSEYAEYQKLNNVYKQLFRIFNKTQQFGEEYELIIGTGLLNFKEDSDHPKIFRHILTQRVDINFEYSQKDSQIIISPNLESTVQIETDSILDLFDQFDSQNVIDAEKAVVNYIKEKEIDSIFGDLDDALKMFAEQVSPDGSYFNSVEKPQKTHSKPIISYSPALLLRKRNTKSFTALYEKILDNISNDTDEIDIPTINDLIGITPNISTNLSNGENSKYSSENEPIFFPKEYNDEQIEIIEKAKRNNKVLVQGPPGTGKSHTIANLICHLLANGKKILITAHTKRALEVLKDKLPKEFQDLAVNLLSGDSSSIQDLQKSVNSINDELSRADLYKYQSEIDELQKSLKATREKFAINRNELIGIKEKSTRKQEINPKYSGTLTQIAESLEKDSTIFEWYYDAFSDINDTQIIPNFKQYVELYEKYLTIDVAEFKYDIPDPNKLPTIEQIREYKNLKNNLLENYSPNDEHLSINCSDYEKLIQLLKDLKVFYNDVDSLQIDFSSNVISTYLNGNSYKWNQTLEHSTSILEKIDKYDLRKIDKDIEVSLPSGKSLKRLKKDAQTLLNHLREGNPLSGLSFKLKKSFLSKEIKERLYFIDEIRVNGSPCDTIEEFEIVLRDIAIQQDLLELSELWAKEIPEVNSLLNKFNYYKHIHSEVSKLLKIIDQSEALRKDIELFSNLKINPFEIRNLEKLIIESEYNNLLKQIEVFRKIFNEAEFHLNNINQHPIKENVLEDFKDINYKSYGETLKKIEKLDINKNQYQNYILIKGRVEKHLPLMLDSIQSDSFVKNNIQELENAILYRNAQKEINRLMDVDYEQQLILDLNELENKERKLIAQLGSKMAWAEVLKGLDEDKSLRQHLNAFAQFAIKARGKGKKATKFQKDVQKQMEKCKDSVPCWIMDFQKVAESIIPEQGMYDYVIIDEASQLGPDAIFLLYISKNIIIVGDDKQIAPENVGVDIDKMTPHIEKYLGDFEFKNCFHPAFSFFDFAKVFCDGMTVLQEHFRCMPEIIEFCNKHFYAPSGKGLYPLKQYSENRLEPLKSVFCANGYVEGKYAYIINAPEAYEIAETIAKLIEDERYNGKTFGIITLQGNQQSNQIENLLLKKIGEQEYFKRKILCGNSASFQGDERDIIFLSLISAHNHIGNARVRPEDERRFNVAVSRAKEQIWLFHSIQLEDLSNTNDLRYKLLDHFKNYNSKQPILSSPLERGLGTQPDPFDSWFEVDVYNDIVRNNFSVIPQYEVAKGRYRIDLVALFPDGTKIAIECDGDKWHGAEQYQNDLMRQKILERCGWQFFRVRGYEYYTNRIKALEPLWKMIPKIQEKKPVEIFTLSETISEDVNAFPTSIESIDNTSTEYIISDFLEDEIILQKEQSNSVSTGNYILRYFNLYKSGKYIMTNNEPLEADFVIPIKSSHTDGFLLQCYASGHINKLYVSVLLSKKIGKDYMNGLNKNDEISYLKIIESEKIIGINFIENGVRKFKAHLTENISSREQLQLQGYKVIYNDFEKIEYKILPLDILEDINRLVFHSFTANGKAIDNNYYDQEWSVLNQFLPKKVEKENKVEPKITYINKIKSTNRNESSYTLFDSKVELQSIVKLKYLNNDKLLTIQLVDYHPQKMEIINGVQKIYNKAPLSNSILGKYIGDKVKIGDTDSYVEILEIINTISDEILEFKEKSNTVVENIKSSKEFEYLPDSKLPIGKYVRKTLKEVITAIDRDELARLQRAVYSKDTFGILHPFLKKVLISETKKPKRYWKDPVRILGELFWVCSEWFENEINNDRPFYDAWLKKMRDKL